MKQSRVRKMQTEAWKNTLERVNPKCEELCKAIRAMVVR